MKAIVVFDSKFGNTEKVARALALGLQEGGVETDCMRFDQVVLDRLRTFDVVAIGSPTQNMTISKPLNSWLKGLSRSDVEGKRGFAFDTRFKRRFAGSAAKRIQARMNKLRMTIVQPPVSAIVLGAEGPLEPGSEETFRRMGADVARQLVASTVTPSIEPVPPPGP